MTEEEKQFDQEMKFLESLDRATEEVGEERELEEDKRFAERAELDAQREREK